MFVLTVYSTEKETDSFCRPTLIWKGMSVSQKKGQLIADCRKLNYT